MILKNEQCIFEPLRMRKIENVKEFFVYVLLTHKKYETIKNIKKCPFLLLHIPNLLDSYSDLYLSLSVN